MDNSVQNSNIGYLFMVLASVVIVLAGIKSASSVVVPFLLSTFIAIILTPAYKNLNNRGIANTFSITIVISVFIFFILFVVKLIGTSAHDFSSNLGLYTQQLSSYFHDLISFLIKLGIDIPEDEILSIIDPKEMMQFSGTIVHSLSSLFTNGFVILLSVVFMLLESDHFAKKITLSTDDENIQKNISEILSKIQRYMVIKAVISLLTAFIIWIGLSVIGTSYPFLWAVLAFLLNFIPNIGSIIAALPPFLITLVQLGSFSAFLVLIVYFTVNIFVGSIMEPRIMGRGLGLSTLVVFLSLIFWGWLLGIVGMLLSVPLTMMMKIALDSNKHTKWIAIFLGNVDK